MNFNVPTRTQAKDIVEKCEAFYCNETLVDGYQVEMYDYRLASYNDFKDNNALELRGITYIFNIFTNQWETNIALNKFFNLNQNTDWNFDDVKDKKIISVQEKLDGSMIHPVRMPNGKIRMKSKMSFESDQAKAANEIYSKDKDLQNFIDYCFNSNLMPIFEYTSFNNQIVIEYGNPELTLLQVRDKGNGNYFDLSLFKKFNIKIDNKSDNSDLYNLEKLSNLQETETGTEGWVVTFEDGQMLKIKTKWYMERHGIFTQLREDDIIKLTLDQEVDDVIASLSGEKKVFVEDVSQKVINKFNHLVVEYKELRRKYFQDFEENRKEFSIKHNKDRLFSVVMKYLNTSFTEVEKVAEEGVKEYILWNYKTLSKAREFVNEIYF